MNISYNLTGLSQRPAAECFVNGQYKLECLHSLICPQFNSYFINTGLVIIIAYIFISWLLWWYLNFGYMKYPLPHNDFWGDINKIETRIFWDMWVRARIAKVMLVFIAIVVWLSINRK